MTADELAKGYFIRARKRFAALRTLMEVQAYPDVVRESQELVEPVLKAILRWVVIDPPKWHDVGSILLEHQSKYPAAVQAEIPALAEIYLRLGCDCENALYGDIDLIPDRVFGREAAQQALADAERVLAISVHFIGP